MQYSARIKPTPTTYPQQTCIWGPLIFNKHLIGQKIPACVRTGEKPDHELDGEPRHIDCFQDLYCPIRIYKKIHYLYELANYILGKQKEKENKKMLPQTSFFLWIIARFYK